MPVSNRGAHSSDGACHWKEEGKTRTLHVPQETIGEVVQWVKTWKELRRLIAEMGKEQRKHLQQIKKELKD